MKTLTRMALVAAGVVVACLSVAITVTMAAPTRPAQDATAAAKEHPSLTVAVTRLQPTALTSRVAANGNIMAWQEASIGAEANGQRLVDVRVNVGDKVRRGQLLAVFAAETFEAELAQSRAAVAEAEAALADAAANAQRTRVLQESGALSGQQIQQYVTAAHTALARLDWARATERMQRLRLAQTQVVAPDDGVISARVATVGAVVPAGQELFRLIRTGRLEWRAEVAAGDFAKLKPGQKVRVTPSGGDAIEGRLRMLGPMIDVQTRNGLVYVDLTSSATARAGMFARGEFELGSSHVVTLPRAAVLLRDGFSHVLRVGPDSRVVSTKVAVGRRSADRVEILSGLAAADRVVATGAAFLGDGDLVRVVEEQAAATAPPALAGDAQKPDVNAPKARSKGTP